MKGAGRVFAASTLGVVLLLGCPPHKSSGNKSPEPEAAAPLPTPSVEVEAEAPPVAAAANEIDVTRYPDEAPIDHALGTTRVFASAVRTQASATAGILVDSLKAQTDVDEIAERQGFILIYFIDPKDESRKLMGWVAKSDFTASGGTTGTAQALTCTAPLTAVQHSGGESCERTCVDDRGCGSGLFVCTGSGEQIVGGKPAGAVRFCRAAGAGPIPVPTGAPQRPLDVRQQNGSCPGGYMRCGVMCRLTCRAPTDCGGQGHCLAGYCFAPGAAPCAR